MRGKYTRQDGPLRFSPAVSKLEGRVAQRARIYHDTEERVSDSYQWVRMKKGKMEEERGKHR